MIVHIASITLAVCLDRIIGDPPNLPHPVRWMGSLIAFLERVLNRGTNRKRKGIFMLGLLLALVYSITLFLTIVMYKVHPAAGIMLEGIIISTTIASKSLKKAAMEVFNPLVKGDLQEARKKLSYIVGRDTESLEEKDVIRGAVETVAENTSDGITAPLFWALIGGAPLAIVYRMINTCDSMVGYKSDRYLEFGWASAKVDDLVNWLPSRITAVVMIVVFPSKYHDRLEAWKITRKDSRKHPSPNSGWGEAAAAVILGIKLGGRNYYKGMVSDRAIMGKEIVPLNNEHIRKTINLMERTVFGFYIFLLVGGILIESAFTWVQSALFI
ncbi:adenosylcobinamide-phosphate synthase CbiB [Bacillus salacetis]|uniref:adenosylcobinamide-phosphate synthase CbiB n=1 Tax=Bacillus salacetis TaxID=2315464 RepID=UPI003B9FFC17